MAGGMGPDDMSPDLAYASVKMERFSKSAS